MTMREDLELTKIPSTEEERSQVQIGTHQETDNEILHTKDIWKNDKLMILANGWEHKPGIIPNEKILKESLNDDTHIKHLKQTKDMEQLLSMV